MGSATLTGLRAATTFLTRVDVGGHRSDDIARGVPWFPVVGGIVGVAAALLYAGAREVLPSFVASSVALAFSVWLTRAFHEDGLADTFDAFGAARSRNDTLRIMKDPRLGTYGVAAFVFSVAIRLGALAAIDATAALAVLPAAHALSRAGAVALLRGSVATDEGLGASYASVVAPSGIWGAMGAGLVIGLVTLGPVAAGAIAAVAVVDLVVARAARARIGGVTGDVLGAAQQLGEIVVLLVGVTSVQRGWLDVPWW
ncbi:MAG TPA: adenosylcobinamide-GDP ribazoletransferase [Actinomycetota bacterium]|jgi:adenosylcobinamide-GDP ribazoletransferase|nr:adenosylcobinamide-GDP ribazoletransferase [Actinomycetota bacterium]